MSTYMGFSENLITEEFIAETWETAELNPNKLTINQVRLLNYKSYNPEVDIIEGSRLQMTCMDNMCVNPDHIEIIPPLNN